ncbi:TPA: P-loop NTPase fold protein [Escherichia coli]
MESIEVFLKNFLDSDHRVAVIKGNWGVGKTHYWNSFYTKHSKKLDFNAYSYVSLFGINSIGDIKKALYHCATPINEKKYKELILSETDRTMIRYRNGFWGWLKYNSLSKFLILFGKNDFFGFKTDNLLSSLEYKFVNNYLVCIDDIERKGSALEIKEIMGVIDELARRKNCKVVLILNEDNLHEETAQQQFLEYREKIIDVEIKYDPTPEKNLRKVFYETDPDFLLLKNLVNDLNIKNIRILNKIKSSLVIFRDVLKLAEDKVRESFINRLVLFSVVYYFGVPSVDYASFKESIKNIHAFDYMLDDKDEKEEVNSVYSFVNSLDVIYERAESAFDDDIDFYLKNGYVSSESNILNIIKEKNEQYRDNRVLCEVYKIWDVFRNSFKDNESEFIFQIERVINDSLLRIPIGQFVGLINVLIKLDRDCNNIIEAYADAFVNKDNAYATFNSLRVEIFGNEELGFRIEKKLKDRNPDDYNLDKIIKKIAGGRFNHSDVNILNSFSKDDYVNWILSCDQDALNLVEETMLKFKGMQHPTDEQKSITDKAIEALEEVASKSTLNKLRVNKILNH